jgi:cobyrinic acid a,c-diamide synthase
MSVPRIMLVPTHRTGLANAIAAAAAEIVTAQGRRVRYHHLGPLCPGSAWDRWEGAAFLDPALYDDEALLGLYEVATRGSHLSLLSSSVGALDRREGAEWLPIDVAHLLDCPVVVVMDCRGWGTGIRALVAGLNSHLVGLNLAGAILSGVADRQHYDQLRQVLDDEGVPVAGCLFEGDGPGWASAPPGAWGLPLDKAFLEAVGRQVDLNALVALAGQRGFLSSQNWLLDRGGEGPLIMVVGGKGFTPWSRDSIEVLRSAGAQVRRLDLLEDEALPPEASGLVLAGTAWPADLLDITLNQPLLRDLRLRINDGLPTVALGGGMLLLLNRIQDSLGRTAELADVIPGEGEILWDLEEAAYVEVTALRDNLLLSEGETITAWETTEAEVLFPKAGWDPPLSLRSPGSPGGQPDGAATDSLICSKALLHLSSAPAMAARFVRRCADYGAARNRRGGTV